MKKTCVKNRKYGMNFEIEEKKISDDISIGETFLWLFRKRSHRKGKFVVIRMKVCSVHFAFESLFVICDVNP